MNSNNIFIKFFSPVIAAVAFPLGVFAQPAFPQLDVDSLHRVIAAMTTAEKSLMVTGAKRREIEPVVPAGFRQKNITAVGGYTYPFPRLGIPPVYLSDGPAGLRIAPRRLNSSVTYHATAFPVATLLASSWDTSLVREVGEAMGKEALEYGVDILLGPAMNIHRDPLGGRSFEYFSEDPLITGWMAAAMINGIQSQGIGACIKHFAVNNQETNRRNINAIISERALREIYLEGFRVAVKNAKPWTVMSSYNKINGVYTSQSKDLLITLLRKEWGFDGLVLSDWYGGDDPVAQMNAGNDLLMPGLQEWSDKIALALTNGSLEERIVNDNIENILKIIIRTSTFKKYAYSEKPNFKKSREIALRASMESIVLLKNENRTLPLASTGKIALFGNYSYKNLPGGTGSGAVNYESAVSIADGLTGAGYRLDQELSDMYLTYLKVGRPMNDKADSLITAMPARDSILRELPVSYNKIEGAAKNTDVAFITIMRIFGEGGDRSLDNFNLTAEEHLLIDMVSTLYHAQHKKVIVLLNIGGVVETTSWKDKVDGILLLWQSGQEGGVAAANIISGKMSPSGKLATSFPVRYKDVPSAPNFPGEPPGIPVNVTYAEDIYVGYRYYESFKIPVSFAFGHGLSYTDFVYSDLNISNLKEDSISLNVTIRNNGTKPGKEVVQLYVNAPKGDLDKPEKELKAFAKTKLLLPGEQEQIWFSLTPRQLSSFYENIQAWKAGKGIYQFKVGASSADIKLQRNYRLKKDIITEKVSRVLLPVDTIETINNKLIKVAGQYSKWTSKQSEQ